MTSPATAPPPPTSIPAEAKESDSKPKLQGPGQGPGPGPQNMNHNPNNRGGGADRGPKRKRGNLDLSRGFSVNYQFLRTINLIHHSQWMNIMSSCHAIVGLPQRVLDYFGCN